MGYQVTPKLFVMCGIPGSGKTTYSKKVAAEHNAVLHTFDELPDAFSPTKHETVRASMRTAIAEDLRKGRNVVCDDVHIMQKHRAELLKAIDGIECEKVLIVMETPLEECLKRNAGRKMRLHDVIIHSCAKRFERPSADEGWQKIITVQPQLRTQPGAGQLPNNKGVIHNEFS